MPTKNLHLLMTADAKGVEREVGKTERGIKGMAATAKQGFGNLASSLGSMAGLLSTGAIVYSLKQGVDQILDMEDASSALGISMEKVAGLKFAAEGNWDAAQAGIAKMMKTIGEARVGSVEASKGLRQLGLDAKSLSSMPTERTLGIVADRLMAIENPAERAYAASQLFGKGWVAMVPLLEKGSAGLDHAADVANRFGAVSEVQAQRLKLQKRQFEELAESMDSFKRKAVISLSEAYAGTANLIDTLTTGTSVEAQNALAKRIESRYQTDRTERIAGLAEANKKKAQTTNQPLIDAITDLEEKLRGEEAALRGAGSGVEDFAKKHADATPELLKNARALEATNKALKDQQEREKEMERQADAMIKVSLTPWESFQRKIADVDAVAAAGKLTWDQYFGSLAAVMNEFDKFDKSKADYRPSGALELGGAEEFSARMKFMRDGEQAAQASTNRTEDILKQIREHSRDTKKASQETAEQLKKLGVAKF